MIKHLFENPGCGPQKMSDWRKKFEDGDKRHENETACQGR